MMAQGEGGYLFQTQRGRYRRINPNWAREFELLECRRGLDTLPKPIGSVWGSRQAATLGFSALGIVLADLDWMLYVDWRIPFSLGLLVAAVEAVCFAAAVVAGGRAFLRYVARHSRSPGEEVKVVQVAYGSVRHSLTVSSQGATFALTVLGSRARLERAMALVASDRLVQPAA